MVFQSSVTVCIACHWVQRTSRLGALAKVPLSAVGAGFQTELIIEAIILAETADQGGA
jgi:hypothetical protein